MIWIPISIIEKHFVCPRQAFLTFIEKEQEDNVHTIKGKILHKHVVHSSQSFLHDSSIHKAVYLKNEELMIHGIADTIEVSSGITFPVEYKKGGKKGRVCEHLQLCLQVLCLEEMLHIKIPFAFIYHGKTKKRERVEIDETLRLRTKVEIGKTRKTLEKSIAPAAMTIPSCNGCNLVHICLPFCNKTSLSLWKDTFFKDES